MSTEKLTILTERDRPSLPDDFWPQKERIWQPYMFHDIAGGPYWDHLHQDFPEYQLYLMNEKDQPVAVAQTAPCVWEGTSADLPIGWADGLTRAVENYQAGATPNTLMAYEIAIQPEYTGQGISYRMLGEVRQVAEAQGFQAVIVAVRPSFKPRYPITPMERYVHWTQEDGAPFDPWLRAHWRVGGEILKTAHPSMVIEGTVAEWEEWTGMRFPDSGEFIVPGALVPIQIDLTADVGRYVEPNVWVHHPITTTRLRGEKKAEQKLKAEQK